MVKFIRYFLLCVGCGGLVWACGFSGIDKESRVINAKPVPQFSIPDRIAGKKYVCFIAIGDQGTGDSSQAHVAQLMNAKAQEDSLNFVLTLGDNFYGNGVSSVDDAQWQNKFEDMYALPFLHVPFYATLGNHDHHFGNAPYQVEYSSKNPNSLWRMPSYYYTFTRTLDAHATIQFFALNTQSLVKLDENSQAQMAWLERELQASTATWKIVYGHHPVFSYGKHGEASHMGELVRPLLEKYAVDAYLCGHDHDRQLLGPVHGVHYLVSGTGAKSRDTRYGEITIFAATKLGFAWFRVCDREMHLQFINAEGKVEYAYTWSKGTSAHDLQNFTTK